MNRLMVLAVVWHALHFFRHIVTEWRQICAWNGCLKSTASVKELAKEVSTGEKQERSRSCWRKVNKKKSRCLAHHKTRDESKEMLTCFYVTRIAVARIWGSTEDGSGEAILCTSWNFHSHRPLSPVRYCYWYYANKVNMTRSRAEVQTARRGVVAKRRELEKILTKSANVVA